jgi:c-di-GMP-binding flagellar brake protein YcgR
MNKPIKNRPPVPPPPPVARAAQQPRAHPRTRISLSAEVDNFTDRFTARARDLSLGGAGLDLDRPIKEGAAISLALFLVVDEVEDEQTKPLTVRANVAWCAESDEEGRFSAGVRFENLAPRQAEWLEEFLASLKQN